MKQAMIFAAGLGTRLKPLTDCMPKALVPVAGEPLLRHVVLRLKAAGFERIVVNVHHFADQVIDYLAANDRFGLDIRISDEREQLLDTGGGIRKALPLFDPVSPILIHNVDILSNVDLAHFYDAGHRGAATLLVSNRQTKRYLLFDRDKPRRLRGWTNTETHEVKSPYGNWNVADSDLLAFSGIHVFTPELFSALADMPQRFGIIDFYLKQCAAHAILGYVDPALRLMDVGKQETLRVAEDFVSRQLKE